MLASVGLLSEQHKQGVVALLGGELGSTCLDSNRCDSSPATSTSTPALLIQEPASLLHLREQHNIGLSELAVPLVWFDHSQRQDDTDWMPALELTKDLLSVFSPTQLPAIAHLNSTLSAAGSEASIEPEQVALREGMWELWEDSPLADIYLSWVQATLLKIIDNVLSRQHR
jgi:hypothetical protein